MAPPRPERSGLARLVAAWRALAREQRLVVVAAGVLLATMALPWYSRSVDAVVGGKLETATSAKLAITVFSFVEAAIFLVAVGVTALVLARGDKRAFHLPGGDGTIVSAAGAWATFLIFYRFVDKPGGSGSGQLQVEYGLSWGIFFGLLAALALVAAGLRLGAAQVAEPALPGDLAPDGGPVRTPVPPARAPRAAAPSPAARSDDPTRARRRQEREERRRAARATAETPVRKRRPPPDEAPTRHTAPDQAPTRHTAPDEAPTRHTAPDQAPTRPFGTPPSFEPPEFPPPPKHAGED